MYGRNEKAGYWLTTRGFVDPFVYNWAMDYNKKLAAAQTNDSVKNDRKLTHLLSYEPYISPEQLHTINCPTLVIGGDHDVILPQHTMLIAQNIKSSYLWIIPNSGYSTPVFKKDKFNKIVEDFFASPFRTIEGFGRFE